MSVASAVFEESSLTADLDDFEPMLDNEETSTEYALEGFPDLEHSSADNLNHPTAYYSLPLGSLPPIEVCQQFVGMAALLSHVPIWTAKPDRVWEHFFSVETTDQGPRGVCQFVQDGVQCRHPTFSMSTTKPIWARHARAHHSHVYQALMVFKHRQRIYSNQQAAQAASVSASESALPTGVRQKFSDSKYQHRVYLLAKIFTINCIPLNFLKSKQLRDLLYDFDSNFVLPSLPKFDEMLSNINITKIVSMQDHLSTIQKGSITADGWKSKGDVKYVGVTFHFFRHSDFEMQSVILGMEPVDKSQTAVVLKNTLHR